MRLGTSVLCSTVFLRLSLAAASRQLAITLRHYGCRPLWLLDKSQVGQPSPYFLAGAANPGRRGSVQCRPSLLGGQQPFNAFLVFLGILLARALAAVKGKALALLGFAVRCYVGRVVLGV